MLSRIANDLYKIRISGRLTSKERANTVQILIKMA